MRVLSRLLPLAALALLVVTSAADEEAAPAPAPDLAFYRARVAPIVHGNCAECHADPRKRLGRHFLRPRQGRPVSERDHERNYATILSLVEPGNPARSLWLLKALGPRQGGVEHGGGERIRFDGLEYAAMVDFINGVRLEAPTATAPSEPSRPPEVGKEGLVLGVDDLALSGSATVDPGDGTRRWIDAGREGGTASARFALPAEGTWRITLDVIGPGRETACRIDGGAPRRVAAPGKGFVRVGPDAVLDGGLPLLETSGRLDVRDTALAMEGRHGAPAAWLSPARVDHARLEATFDVPPETAGGDDAYLLFDMEDGANGKLVGLVDGGRRFVMGLLEGGVARILATEDAPPREGPRILGVDLLEGVAVGRLDGRARAFLHLDRHLGRGRFGARTHAKAAVLSVVAYERWEVYRTAFSEAPVWRLGAGVHALAIDLPPGAPALVAARIDPVVE